MTIQVLKENLFNDYDEFLLTNKNNLLYASSKYLLFLEKVLKCKTYVLIVKVDDTIIACLPLMYKDGNLGRVYNSLPFYGGNGGIISNSESATSLLIKKYNEIINYVKNETTEFVKWFMWLHKEMPELRKVWEKELK